MSKIQASRANTVPIGKLIQESRQGRGLTQEQLAQVSGVAYTTLTKVESGAIRNPSTQVVSKLAKALGVSLDALLSPQIYHGPSSVDQIFKDVLESLRTEGDYMCISGIEEGTYLQHVPKGVLDFVAELKRRGISQKLLCCEGDTDFLEGDHIEYRWIPKAHFYPVPMYVYGDKVAILVWGPPQQSIIIENSLLAEAYRRQFLFLWENATPVPKKLRTKAATSNQKARP